MSVRGRSRCASVTFGLALLLSAVPGVRTVRGASVTASIPVGVLPYGIGLNPASGLLYVANEGDSTVSVVSTSTNSTVRTIPLAGTLHLGGSASAIGVAVNPVTNTVYVAETGAAQVAVIDGATNTLTTSWHVAPGPWGIAVDAARNTIYVSSLSGSVTVIDGASGTVAAVITDPRLQRPTGLALNPTTGQLYVASFDGNSLVAIDGVHNLVTGSIAVGKQPAAVAVDPSSGLVYVANAGDATVSVIDPAAGSVRATWGVGTGPRAVAVDPAAQVLYVAAADNSVRALDDNGQLIAAITDSAMNEPEGLALGASVYVSSGGADAVVTVTPVQPPPQQ